MYKHLPVSFGLVTPTKSLLQPKLAGWQLQHPASPAAAAEESSGLPQLQPNQLVNLTPSRGKSSSFIRMKHDFNLHICDP